jgi:hypothetical protein
MENFSTLSASVSGGNVLLTWTFPGEAVLTTSFVVQRADFGTNDYVTQAASADPIDPPVTAGAEYIYPDNAPEQGQYSYRVVATVTQPDLKTYTLTSNVVDVTVSATSGVVVLSGSVATPNATDISGPRNYSKVSLSWVVDNAGLNDDVLKFEVLRYISGVNVATFRTVATTSQLTHDELLPTGTGQVEYAIKAYLPNVGTGNQLNTPIVTTSNVVTLTV